MRVAAEVDGGVTNVETVTIQNIVSWATVKDKSTFRLTVKGGALASDPKFSGAVDFGTEEAEDIQHDLREVAQELAKLKKVERAAFLVKQTH